MGMSEHEIVISLMELLKKVYKFEDDLSKVLMGDLERIYEFTEHIEGTILKILEIPEDTTLEKGTEEGFCRDGFYMRLLELKDNPSSELCLREFLNWKKSWEAQHGNRDNETATKS